ncbi:ATP-binding protein [Actinoplanes sp. NPDC051851]|uniref:sensor histidine kinase n=1 Tax=Actinoplanes sp. NPDC051851 TaxID=3154753 RepID=UPI00342AFB8F
MLPPPPGGPRTDAGPGLSPEQRVRALEPFWRTPGAPKGGTGLGLALVCKPATAGGGHTRLDPATPTGLDAVVTL